MEPSALKAKARAFASLPIQRLRNALAGEQLGYLDAVQGRALAKLIAADPQVQGVRITDVFADAPDEAIILALGDDRHRVAVVCRVVDHPQPGESTQQLACPARANLGFSLRIDRDRVRREDRHSHGSRRDQKIGSVQDFAHFVDQLYFLAGVAALEELVDVRNEVEGDLMLKELRLDRFPLRPGEDLFAKFRDAVDPRSRYSLKAGRNHPLQAPRVVERF